MMIQLKILRIDVLRPTDEKNEDHEGEEGHQVDAEVEHKVANRFKMLHENSLDKSEDVPWNNPDLEETRVWGNNRGVLYNNFYVPTGIAQMK